MTQQGDSWWDKLYDASVPDTAPTASGDTLDEHFDTATRATVGPPARTPGESPAAGPVRVPEPARDPRVTRLPDRAADREPAPDPTPPPQPSTPPPVTPPPVPPPAPSPSAPSAPGAAQPPPAPLSPPAPPSPAAPPVVPGKAPWEAPDAGPRTFPGAPPPTAGAPTVQMSGLPAVDEEPETDTGPDTGPVVAAVVSVPRPRTGFVGSRPPTYEAEPTALPVARPGELAQLVADTVLDGARYGTCTLRAASVRGDSARYRGEPRRDALLTARFGHDGTALVLVAVAAGSRAAENAHLAAADACHWIAEAVGRSHARLSEDIRSGRRGDLKSGLHRLTDRTCGKLRARAVDRGLAPDEYTATLRCLLVPADPECRTRVFFGTGGGGLFRLRDGSWQDLEPLLPGPNAATGAPAPALDSPPTGPEATRDGDRLTVDLDIATAPPLVEEPVPPPAEPFRFRASVARPGDTLLLASPGLADPMRGEPALAQELATRWAGAEPPGLAAFLADTQLRVTGYADDRTGVAVWEA
ncbi:protein phosphatase 2C domain-containing protein [Streptomyces sp. bgisy060]|uniref:protein phosphatase 2C domain-containing protein n=1 Tax=Streptomyces sp. bgisy060 TaxID=3413775 RepID=UPI003EBBF354